MAEVSTPDCVTDFSVTLPIGDELKLKWKTTMQELHRAFLKLAKEIDKESKVVRLETVTNFLNAGFAVFTPIEGKVIDSKKKLMFTVTDVASAIAAAMTTGNITCKELVMTEQYDMADKMFDLVDKLYEVFQVTSDVLKLNSKLFQP